ncbi:MAG: NAD(P)/FAD-dependent oxidoreductase [Geminicoccaceae bacterium]
MPRRDLPDAAEIVVIGAGISGLCCGLCLAAAGREVLVLDRGDPWGDASGVNAGTLSVQVKRPEVLDVTREAVRLWGSFREAFGVDVGFGQPGGVRVATTPREVGRLRESVRVQRGFALEVELLEGNEARDRFPWLGPAVLAASLCDLDAYSSPLLAGPALLRACRQAGVLVVGHAGVEAIEAQAARCLRVRTAAGALACRRLVIAAGAWTGEVAAMLGVALPVLVDVNMLTVTEPAPPFLERIVTHIGGVLSLKQYPNGTCLIGGGWQGRGGLQEGGRRELHYENFLHNMRVAAGVVPALAGLRVVRAWSGFEAVAPDALPVVGRLPGHENAFVLAGARGGYSQGPALGRLLAELILEGHTTLPLQRFDPARFQA